MDKNSAICEEKEDLNWGVAEAVCIPVRDDVEDQIGINKSEK